MGLFWDDNEIKKIQQKLAKSANYQFCNEYLPTLFFYKPEMFWAALKNPRSVTHILMMVIDTMKKNGLDVKQLLKTRCTAKLDKEKKVIGFVFEIPGAELEMECNFVATAFTNSGPRYYLSELYEDGSFGLCGRNEEGMHLNYGSRGGDIRTVDDMWQAILSLK